MRGVEKLMGKREIRNSHQRNPIILGRVFFVLIVSFYCKEAFISATSSLTIVLQYSCKIMRHY